MMLRLRTLIIVTDANGAIRRHAFGPEAFQGSGPRKMSALLRFGGTNKIAHPDIASWVKRSQNPKTGLARTSRTA